MIALLLAGALTLQTPDLVCRVRDSKGTLIRSRARVCLFLRMAGYVKKGEVCRVPEGMRVDHIVSLACGGADLPSNMQLLTEAEWKAKTAWERRPCSAWWDGTNARLLQGAIDDQARDEVPAVVGRPNTATGRVSGLDSGLLQQRVRARRGQGSRETARATRSPGGLGGVLRSDPGRDAGLPPLRQPSVRQSDPSISRDSDGQHSGRDSKGPVSEASGPAERKDPLPTGAPVRRGQHVSVPWISSVPPLPTGQGGHSERQTERFRALTSRATLTAQSDSAAGSW